MFRHNFLGGRNWTTIHVDNAPTMVGFLDSCRAPPWGTGTDTAHCLYFHATGSESSRVIPEVKTPNLAGTWIRDLQIAKQALYRYGMQMTENYFESSLMIILTSVWDVFSFTTFVRARVSTVDKFVWLLFIFGIVQVLQWWNMSCLNAQCRLYIRTRNVEKWDAQAQNAQRLINWIAEAPSIQLRKWKWSLSTNQ